MYYNKYNNFLQYVVSLLDSKMIEKENSLNLLDLIDIKFLQEFQDSFAETTGVASLTVDKNGAITKPSNFTEFCTKYKRNNPEEVKKCNECDMNWGKLAAEKGEPIIYTCHAGLTDFAVPIMVEGQHLGTILGGQILDKEADENFFRNNARKMGVDEEEYIEALRKIKVVSTEHIKAAAHMLYIVANAISEISHTNLNLYNQTVRENIYRTIVETIRSTLDFDETKQRIVEVIGKSLKADRCFMAEYDKEKSEFSKQKQQYLSQNGVEKYTGSDINKDFPEFFNILKKGQPLIINKKKFLQLKDNPDFNIERETIDKYDINSIFVSPLFYQGDLLGVLSTHYEDEAREISEEEIILMSTVSDQIAIALHQAKLYKITKEKAEREKLIGEIIAKSISTFDITQIKQIVREVGKIAKADRCFFLELEPETKKGKQIEYDGEYLASPDIKTIIGYKFPLEEGRLFIEMYLEAKDVVSFDYDEIEKKQNEKYRPMINYRNIFDLKNSVGIPIFIEGDLTALLLIEYVKEKTLPSTDMLDFLRILGNQLGMTYHQIQIHQNIKKTAEKERLLRRIFEAMRTSLDIDEIKKTIVTEVCKALNSDGCFIVEFDKKTDCFLPITDEHLSSDEIMPYAGTDVNTVLPNYAKFVKNGGFLLFNNGVGTTIQDEQINFEAERQILKQHKIDSQYVTPLNYHNELLGALSVSYNHPHFIGEDEIDLINTVANQIAISLHQSKLYKTAQIQAAREKLIGNIFAKSISTFDSYNIMQIVEDVGKMTGADRCYFVEAEIPGVKGKIIGSEGEYRKSEDVKTIVGYSFPNEDVKKFIEIFEEIKDIVLFDYEELEKTNTEGFDGVLRYSKLFGIKSAIGIPFYALGKTIGILCIEYAKEKIIPSADELDFLRILGNQIGMAYNQIQLYQNTKKTAERESLLRSIFETMRSSLDLKGIKQKIVNEVGKALSADMCFIWTYDSENDILSLEESSEYRSSEFIESFIGSNSRDLKLDFFLQRFKNKKELKAPNIQDFIVENNLQSTKEAFWINSHGIKSAYSVSIYHSNNLLGSIVLGYTQNYRTLDENDIKFLNVIASQAGIAFYHSYLYEKANESARAKAEFIANMSHELKTPLNIVIGFSEILASSQLERKKQVDYLKNINKSGKHLLALTNDIINISKIESGNLDLKYEKVDSKILIMEAVNAINLMAAGKNISIRIETVKATIEVDRKMLTQILYNLLSNAIKFTPNNGNVLIESRLDNEKLIISVTDNGIGIADDDQDKIFEEFKQLDASYEKRHEGAGLGLAITKKLVELHNGSLHVESKHNQGSRFWFALPLSKSTDTLKV